MKLASTLSTSRTRGLSRSLLVALSLGLSAAAANAATTVTVPLGTQEFGNGKEIHAVSTGKVDPSHSYVFQIGGLCQGTPPGSPLAAAVPPDTKISALVNEVQPGAAATLTGIKSNATGTLPFEILNKVYDGDVSIQGIPGHFHFVLEVKIDAAGIVSFDVTQVSITAFGNAVPGTIQFQPGAKVIVGVTPTIALAKATQTTTQAAPPDGYLHVVINRTVNQGVESIIHVATVAGTATKTSFGPISKDVTFLPGQASKTVKIKIKQNPDIANARQFKVVISKPRAALLGDIKTDQVTINP